MLSWKLFRSFKSYLYAMSMQLRITMHHPPMKFLLSPHPLRSLFSNRTKSERAGKIIMDWHPKMDAGSETVERGCRGWDWSRICSTSLTSRSSEYLGVLENYCCSMWMELLQWLLQTSNSFRSMVFIFERKVIWAMWNSLAAVRDLKSNPHSAFECSLNHLAVWIMKVFI